MQPTHDLATAAAKRTWATPVVITAQAESTCKVSNPTDTGPPGGPTQLFSGPS